MKPASLRLLSPLPPEERPRRLAARELFAHLEVVNASARRIRAGRGRSAVAVHDLRVGLRRFTAGLDLWAPAMEKRTWRKARRSARRLRRALAAHRDLEVLHQECTTRVERVNEVARPVLQALIERLERRLAKARADSAPRLRRRRLVRLGRLVLRALRRGGPGSETPARALAGGQIEISRASALEALRRTAGAGRDEVFHEARVEVRRWRYAVESALAIPGAEATEVLVADLRALQQSLGRIQDLAVLRGYLRRRAAKARAKGWDDLAGTLERLAAGLREERGAAIAEAQRRATTLRGAAPAAGRTGRT